MDIKITNIEKKLFVDEKGLYTNIYVDVVVIPKPKIEFLNLDITILKTESKP